MANVRSDFEKGNIADMYKYGWEAYKEQPTVFDQVLEVLDSDKAWEQGTSVIGLGMINRRTSETGDIPVRKILEGYTWKIKSHEFPDRIQFSRSSIDDHQKIKDLVKSTAQQWMRSWRYTQEYHSALLFNEGGVTAGHWIFNASIPNNVDDASGDGIYDGTAAVPSPFFSLNGATKEHTSKGGTDYHNALALDLNVTNLKTAITLGEVTNSKDENDEIVDIQFDTLITPDNALKFTAMELMNSTNAPWKTTRETNVLKSVYNHIPWKFIDTATAWYIGKAKKGACYYNRVSPEFDYYIDHKNKNHEATFYARAGWGVKNYRYWVSSHAPTT